jgi:Ca2+-transporting ATPase
MAVQRAVTPDGTAYEVTGAGYAPDGELRRAGVPVDPAGPPRELARAALLCNDAALAPPDDDEPRWRAVGDPLEAAMVAFAARCGLDPHAERAAWPRVAERPFDAESRRMTTVHAAPGGGYLVVCKGAPEVVLHPAVTDAPAADREALLAAAHRLASAGLRVLAVATGPVTAPAPPAPAPAPSSTPAPSPTPAPAAPEPPAGLRPVGLLAVGDPVRETAAATAEAFDTAGIALVLITGDHPATAAAIGGQLGIWRAGDRVVNGDDHRRGGPPLAAEHADGARVFARTQPDQKLDIIAALQARGHVVAMTGDGVNDAPALRRADIGVAMGGGTEVARQAADLVLVDDNLGTVARAVAEGRRIYDNIRRFLRYALSGGLAEIVVMLAGPLLGLAVPLLPAQILWVNLLTHGLPGVALGAEPAEPGTMRRPPRSPQESVLGGGLWQGVTVAGALIAATVLAVGVGAHAAGRPWQSMVFVVLGLAQLGVALAVRAPRTGRRPAGRRFGRVRGGNPGLLVAVALSAVLQVAGVLLEPLRALLGTVALSPAELAACAAAALLPGLALRLRRLRR